MQIFSKLGTWTNHITDSILFLSYMPLYSSSCFHLPTCVWFNDVFFYNIN